MEEYYKKVALAMKALSDETRLKIYDMLANGELCACKILEEFNISQSTLSYHMKILCDSGLVNGKKDGIWMKYSINEINLSVISGFFGNISQKIK